MRAVRTLVSLLSLMLLATGGRAVLFVLIPAISADVGLSPTVAGFAAVLINLGFVMAMWTVEWLPGNRRVRILRALILAFLVTVGLSLAHHPALVMALLMLLSYALAGYFANGVPWLAAIAPPDKRGQYMGAHELMAMLAYTVGPLYVGVHLPFVGWRSVTLIWSGVLLIVGTLMLFWVAEPPPAALTRIGRQAARKPVHIDLRLLAHASMGACFTMLMSGLVGLLPTWMVGRFGIPTAKTAALIGLVRMSGLVGSPIGGFLSDRVDRMKLMAWYIGLTILILLVLPALPYGPWFITMLALLCLFASAMSPVYYAKVAEAYPLDRGDHLSTVVAISTTVGQVVVPTLMSLTLSGQGFGLFLLAVLNCGVSLGGVIWLMRQASSKADKAESEPNWS